MVNVASCEVGRLEPSKSYKPILEIYQYLCIRFSDSSGCCSAKGGVAEKIPVEPGQGNACAGKVTTQLTFLLRAFPSFDLLSINYE